MSADRERVILLELRLEQMSSALDDARMEADRARERLAESTAREADHARRFSHIHGELAQARAEVADLHRRIQHSEAVRAEMSGHLFESQTTDDLDELIRLRRENLAERERASASEGALSRLRARVEELRSSRDTVLSRVAEWTRLVREDEPEAADLAEFIAELRGEVMQLERRSLASEAREEALRARLVRLGIDPSADPAHDAESMALLAPRRGEPASVETVPTVALEDVIDAPAPAEPAPAAPAPAPRTRRTAAQAAPVARTVPVPLERSESDAPPAAEPPTRKKRGSQTDLLQSVDAPPQVEVREAATREVPAPPPMAAPTPPAQAPAPAAPVAAAPPPKQPDALATQHRRTDAVFDELAAANAPGLRAELLYKLGRGGDVRVVDAIRPWTGWEEFAVRAAAYEALIRLLERHPAELEPHLRAGFSDPDARVRRRVVLAAATARRLALRTLLAPLKEDPDPQVRRVVREVLRQAPPDPEPTGEAAQRPDPALV